jgi:hypothetical protein
VAVLIFWNHFNHNATVFKGLGRKIESCALRRHPIAGLVDVRQSSPQDPVALIPELGTTDAWPCSPRKILPESPVMQSIEGRTIPRTGVAMSLVSVAARSMAADAPYRATTLSWKLTAAPKG